jgi:citrate lyase subunit beta/citryl-CoA lyase
MSSTRVRPIRPDPSVGAASDAPKTDQPPFNVRHVAPRCYEWRMPQAPEHLLLPRSFNVRRSELTCPASSPKMMTKAAASGADEVILDLEDAVALSQKESARASLIEALPNLAFGDTLRAWRCNAIQTRWCHRDIVDVVEQVGRHLDVLVVPKVESAGDVHFIDRLLTQAELAAALPVGKIRVEVLIESASGLLAAPEIARASTRLDSLIFGIADYAGDLGMKDFRDAPYATFAHARQSLIVAARAAGIHAIDGVTVKFRDLEQVAADADAGSRMGFDGKWAIHPSHLEPIHRAYTPTRAELERASALFEAYRRADVEGGVGAIAFEDEMVDAASLRPEWRKLSIGRRVGLIDAEGRLRDPANGSASDEA